MNLQDTKFAIVIFFIGLNMLFTAVCGSALGERIDKLNLNETKENDLIVSVDKEKIEKFNAYSYVIEEEEILKNEWWTDYDLELLARTIFHESGSDEISNEHQQLVAAVVMARLNDERCPNSIYDIIMDDKYGIQYSTRYDIISDNQPEIPQRCYDNALAVLNGEIDYPADLIYQANFPQGHETWKTFETSYSTTYFCRG